MLKFPDFEVVKGKPHGNCSKAKKDSVFISTPRLDFAHVGNFEVTRRRKNMN